LYGSDDKVLNAVVEDQVIVILNNYLAAKAVTKAVLTVIYLL
jgi:hypothetical protein